MYGRITESILALLHPLTLDEDVEIGDYIFTSANQKVKVSFLIPFSPLFDAFSVRSFAAIAQLAERSPRMRKIKIQFPVATDPSLTNR